MWMKFLTWFVKGLIGLLLIASAPPPGNSGLVTINIRSDHFSSDHLGNIFSIQGNTITKLNPQGLQTAQFSWTGFDRIDQLDAGDPFKILLFNRSAGTIIRVNNQLTPLSMPFQLHSRGILDPVAVCNSWDNGCWIYDQSLHELVRINHTGNIDQRSGPLGNIFPEGTKTFMIREHDFRVYLAAPQWGMLIFDKYANHIKSLTIKGINTFQVSQNLLHYPADSTLISFNMHSLQSTLLSLPGSKPVDARIQGNHLLVCYKDSILIQTLNFNP